ncbi:MAG: hypothetical protein JO362_24820 [Streptomycetaceae bacterium]|nr:hypothetical protein [Streptomycetaceae bacterium]
MTRADSRDWNVVMSAPGAAVSLPVDDTSDPRSWAAATAGALLARHKDADAATEAALARILHDAVLDSRTRSPILAFSFCPYPTQGELARVELREIPQLPGRPEPTVDWLEEYFTAQEAAGFDEPQVERGDLPIGPAVRVRRQYTAQPDKFGDAQIMQTVAYAVRPENPVALDSAVVFFMSWTAVVHSEKLFDLADKLAPTLKLVPKSSA